MTSEDNSFLNFTDTHYMLLLMMVTGKDSLGAFVLKFQFYQVSP